MPTQPSHNTQTTLAMSAGANITGTDSCPGCATAYKQCCQPLHQGCAVAQTPEALMRSRYSAYALGFYQYIVATYASAQREQLSVSDIADSAAQTTWLGLRVLDSKILPQSATDAGQFYGEVEFKVFYSEAKSVYCLHERSTFVQEEGLWFYRDGVMLPCNGALKIKRNDPCCCGSSKKFKQCCLPKIQ